MTLTFLCEIHPSGRSKADSSCKTYKSIHSMCRDVDLLYWLLITQCQSPADGERNWFLFFPSIFALTRLWIITSLCHWLWEWWAGAALSLFHIHLSRLVCVRLLRAHLLLVVSCCGIHSLFFRHPSNWQCSKNSNREMSCEKPNDTESRRKQGYHSTAVVWVWTADNTQIQ